MRFISGQALEQGAIITPTDVERELVAIVEALEEGSQLLAKHLNELRDVTLEYDLAQAQAMLRSKETTVDRRKADVLEKTYELHRRKVVLETQVRLIRDTDHNLRAELEALRSIRASVGAAMFEGGGSGRPAQGRTFDPTTTRPPRQ